MSKECLTVAQARTKLGFTGAIPAASNEIVNKEQCLAMKAKTDLLAKYSTSWECPADDDIVKGSKIKYSIRPGLISVGLTWNPGYGWAIPIGTSGEACWKCGIEQANCQPAIASLTGTEGMEYEQLFANTAFIFRISTKGMSGSNHVMNGIFTLPDIDDITVLAGYVSGGILSVDHRTFTSGAFDTDERVYEGISYEQWMGVALDGSGAVRFFRYPYRTNGFTTVDEFVNYMETHPGEGTTIITASEQGNSAEASRLTDLYFGKPYFNPYSSCDMEQLESNIPWWFQIQQTGLEVYEVHFATDLEI